MMLLAIETATRCGSVAVLDGDRVLGFERFAGGERHGAELAPAVGKAIAPFGLSRITTYAISIGPGSFTGLRIGLAFLKGMALVHSCPVVPVSTLEVIAVGLLRRHADRARALAILDARREEVYAGLFSRDGDRAVSDPALPQGAYPRSAIVERLQGLEGIIAGGDGAALDHGEAPPFAVADRELWDADARVLGSIAARRCAAGEGVDVLGLEPMYHQVSAAEAKAGGDRGP